MRVQMQVGALELPWVWTIFFYLICEAIGTAATPGLLCQPRVIVKIIVEKQMECRLVGETEFLGENLPKRHFCSSQNPTLPDPGLNPGRRGGKSEQILWLPRRSALWFWPHDPMPVRAWSVAGPP
jgi:hypothetical protein